MSGRGGASLVIAAAFMVELGLAASIRQLKPTDSSFEREYKQRHRKPQPSPKQLAEGFARGEQKHQKAEAAKIAYMNSPEHLKDVRTRLNKMVQQTRLHPGKRADDMHIQKAQKKGLTCGMKVPVEDLGLKNNDLVQKFFRPISLLQNDPNADYIPMPQPGSGTTQTMADEGRSKMGSVQDAGGEKYIEPYVKVFKDGYSYVGCAKDTLYESGDKYGFNKDQYKMTLMNVSIARYDDLVLNEKQKAMTPKLCYEFCRSMPDMSFFGIRGGRNCYCMPFFDKMESGTERCDMQCPGNPSQMCGGLEKSQLFEMHLCADTQGDVLYAAVNAEEQLVYFYDTVFFTKKIADNLQVTGEKLQAIAGASGDPGAADLGQAAKVTAGELFDPATGWGVCKGYYKILLEEYDKAHEIYDYDFSEAKNLQAAEDVMFEMERLRLQLNKCAKKAETHEVMSVYPFYLDYMASLDEKEWQHKQDKFTDGIAMYYPAIYVANQGATPEMSSCEGELVGRPMPLPLASCAEACNQQLHPERCVAFQYFQIMDGDEQKPLCFMFKEITRAHTYRCNMLPTRMPTSLAQEKENHVTNTTQSQLRGKDASAKHVSDVTLPEVCRKVGEARRWSGLSCQAIFGKETSYIEKCPEQCEDPEGAKVTAICMARLSNGHVNLDIKKVRRCFGKNNGAVDQSGADFMLAHFGADASGGAGPQIMGEVVIGGELIVEPYGHVWTPGPAGKR